MTDTQLSFVLPDSNSELVQQEKNNLEGANTIKQLAEELKQVDIAACLASNAACAHGDSNLWIKTRNVLEQLESIYGNCALTTAAFSAATQSEMNNLKIVFWMLQEAQVEFATEILKEPSTNAKNCQEKSQKLAEDIRKDINKVYKFLEKTRKQIHEINDQKKVRDKELKQAEQDFKVRKQQVQAELSKLEVKIQNLTNEHTTAQNEVKDKQNIKAKQDYFRWTEGVRQADIKITESRRKQIYESLETANENKKQRQHDLDELMLQKKHDDIDIDEDEIDFTDKCLQKVSKGLGQMVKTLGKTTSFWEQVSQNSGALDNSDLQGTIMRFIGSFDKDQWKIWWQNPIMIKIALEYYAKWLALHDVCQEFKNQVHSAQMGVWNLLGEAPTREEGRKKMEEIFRQLKDTQK